MLTIPLSCINLLGLFLLAKRYRTGWLLTVVGECGWGVYGLWTSQWGLALGGFVTACVQVRGWWGWRRRITEAYEVV
jgi:hypothetical protein